MALSAINGCLTLTSGEMDYIRFGSGERVMVMLPGVGDGLKTVKGAKRIRLDIAAVLTSGTLEL